MSTTFVTRTLDIVIVGGSGFWSEQNYIKSLLQISSSQVRLRAIIDPVDPHSVLRHQNLQRILSDGQTLWIDSTKYSTVEAAFKELGFEPDLVIVASNPATHAAYMEYCLTRGINMIVDKPLNVSSNAASSLEAARRIYRDYEQLLHLKDRMPRQAIAVNILRRRGLESFRTIAREIVRCYRQTGQGVTHINLIINGGIHKFPKEFYCGQGAHGYTEGVGALSHSAYHYIDVISWLLQSAPGEAKYLRVGLNSIKRVSDYLATEGYGSLQSILGIGEDIAAPASLPTQILDAELDVSFTIDILNVRKAVIGHINFVFSHTTFCPRTRTIELNGDHANYPDGGRMSHFYLDVHQGPLQSWQVDKNDIVFNRNTIQMRSRKHPHYDKQALVAQTFESAYEKAERPMDQTLQDIIHKIRHPAENHGLEGGHAKDISADALNMRLFGIFYELIALNKVDDHSKITIDAAQWLEAPVSATISTKQPTAQAAPISVV